METNAKLYSLSYSDSRTYLWATVFVACNVALPQLFHLIPQGGIMFAPLSLVILAAAYKLGWRVALLCAVASPLVNHLLTGMPAQGVMTLMMLKLVLLALLGGTAAQVVCRRRLNGWMQLAVLVGVVLTAELAGAAAEWLLTGGVAATVADFTIGWPGLLLQVMGTWLVATVQWNKMN